MYKLAIFAGTTEGRRLAELCAENRIEALVFTATEQGGELIVGSAVHTGRLTAEQMTGLIGGIPLVIDATHPYAREATANIRAACGVTKARYLRLLRESCPIVGESAADMDELVAKLNGCEDTVLSALGSKALDSLAEVKNARERMWLRLLPAEGIEERCAELGFDREKLLLERPPYSVERNIAHLKKSGASVLLTKESGRIGGYPEKAEAARSCGVRMLTLARPAEEGADFGKVWQMIKELEK
ncbi:precorrin-6A/cobalt-precorrin-6A reductase [Ruminococcus sp. YE71]|uniref:precorrin-6A/cobalt-precorrin-6A reductase n=1 Tax=unclassified Ruminococcus TaxID=2608920 RepID=UPI00088679C6|nr:MULTISPECIES: precorrin-6A/cobalt-precorrin-6A reductase [unclassified Ruminococcus]SDA14044.1 precorrin-6A/cobalt-precorrin-6A reductase [Ruminococcus sp. YE78]SFW20400.1 precorrin-6A/cobalt-precorrin-6A reductase [Ruminococcus sp. YE71]